MNTASFIDAGYRILDGISQDENTTRTGLIKTPKRFASAWCSLLQGYNINPKSLFTVFDDIPCDQMIVARNISFVSVCEHHLLPFIGVAHVGYIPQDSRVIGISKVARIVDAFANRVQVQERLTQQVVDIMQEGLNPQGVICKIVARHLCVTTRGVKKQDMDMVTCAYTGGFVDAAARNEFFRHVEG